MDQIRSLNPGFLSVRPRLVGEDAIHSVQVPFPMEPLWLLLRAGQAHDAFAPSCPRGL